MVIFLAQWAISVGGFIGPVAARHHDGHRGLCVTDTIMRAGDVLLAAPWPCYADEYVSAQCGLSLHVLTNARLCDAIVRDERTEYRAIIPERGQVPADWSAQELPILHGAVRGRGVRRSLVTMAAADPDERPDGSSGRGGGGGGGGGGDDDVPSAKGMPTRRTALRVALLGGWAVGATRAVGGVLDFPPKTFRALAADVYREAQEAAGPSAAAAGRRLRVLEIGCGVGLSSVFEDRFSTGSQVLALDADSPSVSRLQAAQARAAAQGYELRCQAGDATDMRTVSNGSVDVVLCSLTLCSVPSSEAAIAEV